MSQADAEPSQVCKIGRTCDGFLPLRPICVAGDSKNADLRHFALVPVTLYSGTCDTSHIISSAARAACFFGSFLLSLPYENTPLQR